MTYFLQSFEGSESSITFYKGKTLRIGRGTNVTLRLDSPVVELEHAEIREDERGYVLADVGGGAGIYVNDQRISAQRLAHGDRIETAGYLLEVRLKDPGDPLFVDIRRIAGPGDETTSVATVSLDMLAEVDLQTDSTGAERAVSKASAPTHARKLPAPRIDYVRAYCLRRGVLRKSILVTIVSLAGAGSLLAVVRQGQWQVFSPGPLAAPHQAVIEGNCQQCHGGWRRVADPACSECHGEVGDHQTTAVTTPACTTCHTEHRGAGALALRDPRVCTDCHRALDTQVLGQTQFVVRITDFVPDDHPDIAVTDDPGGIQDFSHARHLSRLTPDRRPDCGDCHPTDGEGEISPVRFEQSCQKCHNLIFDPRFGSEQAPHAEPIEVLTTLSGRYALRPDILGRLRAADRRRLQGKRLTPERQLHELARMHTERLLRDRCVKCHQIDRDTGIPPSVAGRDPIAARAVRPANLPSRWLNHANFRHRPHLDLMACRDCHREAETSTSPSDVLLPTIDLCFDCHRTPQPGEQDLDTLGRTTCTACHSYHPSSAESAARAAQAMSRFRPTRGGPR